LLLSVAYRHQKIKSEVTQKFGLTYNSWEYKAGLNRLTFGMAIMFR